MPEITVYSKPNCQQCRFTVRRLDHHGLAYTYRDVTTDETAADAVRALGYKELPVVTVGDLHWSGFRLGKLDRLVEIADTPDVAVLDAAAVEYLGGES